MIKKDNKFLKYIHKNKKTSIIVLLVIILLIGAFLYTFRGKKINNSEKTDTLYVATAAPMQQGFGMYNVSSRTFYNDMIRNLIHEPLLMPKTKPTEDKKYEKTKKTTYESNILDEYKTTDSDSSSKTKIYVLKNNIKFHNGVDLTVDDILYSWKKTKELGLESSRYIESFDIFENEPNKFTVTFKNEKNNINEFYLSKIFVINKKECENDFHQGIKIGLGVFQLKIIKNDKIVQLESFDKHPKKPQQPKITKIHFQYYPDSVTRFSEIKNEKIDILIEPTNENISEIKKKNINHLKTVKNNFLNLEFILLINKLLNFDTEKILYDIISANKEDEGTGDYPEIDFFLNPGLIGGNMEDKKSTDSVEAELQNKPQIQKDKKIKILIIQDENNLRNHFLSKLKVVLKEIGFQFDEMKKNDFNTISAIDQKGDFYIVSFDTNENNGKNGNNNDLLVLLDEINNIPIEQKTAHKTENHSEKETDQTGSNSYPEKIKQIQTILKDNYVYVPFFLKQPKNSITRDKIQNFKTDAFGNIIWSDITKTK